MVNPFAKKLGELLTQQGALVTTAESCTGGGLSYTITTVPGCSAWFERGFVTYTNRAKIEMLQVSEQTLNAHGAVSEETAKEMAKGALLVSRADYSIAITGIAGPTGGSKEKPVGTVWIACAKRDEFTYASCHHFSGGREEIRADSVQQALKNLLSVL